MGKQLKIRDKQDFQALQDQLYENTKRKLDNKEIVKFNNLNKYFNEKVIILNALRNVSKNKGAKIPGVDGKDINYYLNLEEEEFLALIRNKFNHYKPENLKRVYIEKPGKEEKRPLGIPTIGDRIVQEIVKSIIEPIAEAHFYNYSFGFRPYRDQHQAIEYIRMNLSSTQYEWIVEGDIKGFFDNIDHTIMLKKLRKIGIRDSKTLMIIRAMLEAGVLSETNVSELGTPQGGIISPLLANIYLNDFDHWINNQWRNKKTKHNYSREDVRINALKKTNLIPMYLTRYADDWVIATNTKENAKKIKELAAKYLNDNLKLKLSDEKTLITNITKRRFAFLGIDFKAHYTGRVNNKHSVYTYPNEERLKDKIEDLKNQIKQLAKYKRTKEEVVLEITKINAVIRGLINYYSIATASSKIFGKYSNRIKWTSARTVKKYGGRLIPANETYNLRSTHIDYKEKINAIKYKDKWIGITSLRFINYKKGSRRRIDEWPYTAEGRKARANRLKKRTILVQSDEIFSIQQMNYYSYNGNMYNVEYTINRPYVFNRDKGNCKCCSERLYGDVNIHHMDKQLPLNEVNEVQNLITVCNTCHRKIHVKDIADESNKKIIKYWKIFNKVK